MSELTITLSMRDHPLPPTLGLLAREHDGRVSIAAVRAIPEPWTTAQIASMARNLVRSWIEPELFDTGADATRDLFESLTKPL